MKIIKLKGGLGNQLFQYAFAKRIEQLTDETVKLDLSYFSNLVDDPIRKPRILRFCLSLPIADSADRSKVLLMNRKDGSSKGIGKVLIAFEGLFNKKYYFEWNRAYRDPAELLGFDYYDGYWQSWKTVDDVWDTIKADLSPNYKLDSCTEESLAMISNEQSVFVGVRKGDYAAHPEHWGHFGNDYYNRAMSYIESKVDNPVFYIFSNDIEWVKEHMSFKTHNIRYRENADIVDDFEDFWLMKNCKHAIMINSTYHWWAARLNDNPEKIVIAPKKWFFDDSPIDIVPPYWLRFPVE